jgi:hypothetical protein
LLCENLKALIFRIILSSLEDRERRGVFGSSVLPLKGTFFFSIFREIRFE